MWVRGLRLGSATMAARQRRIEQQTAADNHANRQHMAAVRAAQTDQQKAAAKARDAERTRAEQQLI